MYIGSAIKLGLGWFIAGRDPASSSPPPHDANSLSESSPGYPQSTSGRASGGTTMGRWGSGGRLPRSTSPLCGSRAGNRRAPALPAPVTHPRLCPAASTPAGGTGPPRSSPATRAGERSRGGTALGRVGSALPEILSRVSAERAGAGLRGPPLTRWEVGAAAAEPGSACG